MNDINEIVKKAAQGDHVAFEQIVTQYEKKIYQLAFRYTSNEQDALDITQEVFLRVYRFLPRFMGDSAFGTWIYRIAANSCKDFLVKNGKITTVTLDGGDRDDEAAPLEISDITYSPEKRYERAELAQEVADAVQALPENMRQIILLREVSGLTYDEIARVLNLEEGTVKSRISRAREKLKIFFTENGNISAPCKSKVVEGGERHESL